MPSSIYKFKLANATDNQDFPRASSSNYNENWNKIDNILSDDFFAGNITAGDSNFVIDEISASDNPGCTWILSLREPTNNKNTMVNIQAVTDQTEVSFVKVHTHLNRVNFELSVDINSGNLRLIISNLEPESIQITGRRLSPFIETNF